MPLPSLRLSRAVFVPLVFALFLFGGVWTTAQGQNVGGQNVGAGAFSRMGFDARGLAVGNALVAAPGTNVSPYYNPALLPEASSQRLSGSAAALAFDRQLQSLEFTTPLGPTAGVGLGLIHAGVRGIDGRNADGRHTETLSTDEFALSLAFGNRFMETLSVGVGFTLYQSDVVPDTNPVRGFGLDIGATYRVTSHLKVAGAVKDMLAKYEWNTSSINGESRTDRFPVRVLLGGSYTLLDDDLHLMAEVESRTVGRDRRVPDRVLPTSGGPRQEARTETFALTTVRGRIGASYRPVDILSLRAGLDRLGIGGVDGMKPSAGFGVRQQVGELDVRLSYAFVMEPYVRTAMHLGTIEVFL
jgi:hypothetical protein